MHLLHADGMPLAFTQEDFLVRFYFQFLKIYNFITWQAGRSFKLQMSKSFDIKEWDRVGAITAIESKNQVVIIGRKDTSDLWSLHTFQNNLDGKLVEKWMDSPCPHFVSIYSLITVVQNGEELLAVLCSDCKGIKLVDMEIQQVIVFKHAHRPWRMCSGPNGGLFITSYKGIILQLDRNFSVINKFDLSSFFSWRNYHYDLLFFTVICYLPAPHNTLVVCVDRDSELRAVSMRDGRQVWSQSCERFVLDSDVFEPSCLLFCPQQDVLLLRGYFRDQVRIMNPVDGSLIQTIEIPNIYYIDAMCLCNYQIVMLQRAEKDSNRRLLSYYNLNTCTD